VIFPEDRRRKSNVSPELKQGKYSSSARSLGSWEQLDTNTLAPLEQLLLAEHD